MSGGPLDYNDDKERSTIVYQQFGVGERRKRALAQLEIDLKNGARIEETQHTIEGQIAHLASHYLAGGGYRVTCQASIGLNSDHEDNLDGPLTMLYGPDKQVLSIVDHPYNHQLWKVWTVPIYSIIPYLLKLKKRKKQWQVFSNTLGENTKAIEKLLMDAHQSDVANNRTPRNWLYLTITHEGYYAGSFSRAESYEEINPTVFDEYGCSLSE